jgi:large subunit ribosomal protein L18
MSNSKNTTRIAREIRHRRIRKNISGSAIKPRLSIFRSSKHIYVQVVDDSQGYTIASAATVDKNIVEKTKLLRASAIGKSIAVKVQEKGIKNVVFDRGGYKYHGRVKALADGAREGGLLF